MTMGTDRKNERVDRILLRDGIVTEEEITQALARQKSHGGRLGTNLMYLRLVTREQLTDALSRQHDVPPFHAGKRKIARNAVEKLSPEIAANHIVLPLGFDVKTGHVEVAAADPLDPTMIARIKEAFGANGVTTYAAPEAVLRVLIATHYHHRIGDADLAHIAEITGLSGNSKPSTPSGQNTVSATDPASYDEVARSLFASLQVVAELRAPDPASLPPYGLLCEDIDRLARGLGLERLARDGVKIAALLLIPTRGATPTVSGAGTRMFVDFDKSIELARGLRFPWQVDLALQTFGDILSGKKAADAKEEKNEIRLGAEILSLVWYVRTTMRGADGPPDEVVAAIESQLRGQAGKLATLDVIEAYVRLLEEDNKGDSPNGGGEIFVIGSASDLVQEFAGRLRLAGFQAVEVANIGEAQRMCERRTPSAVLIDRESFPNQIFGASRLFRLSSVPLVYACSQEADSSTALALFDAGFDDVFVPPFDFDVITARIDKTLKGRSRQDGAAAKPGVFRGTFKMFAFVDLLQTLSQSYKTVRLRLKHPGGERAELYLREGRMVHAVGGERAGVEAIYRVIAWGDEGEFTVEPADDIPADNIFESNEAILMEGCRLLDESSP